MKQLDAAFEALADPTRRRVVELLRERPRRSGELAAAVRASAPAMSRHLRVLRGAQLVEATTDELDARGRVYRLRPQGLRRLDEWLESIWPDQLEAFARHARPSR